MNDDGASTALDQITISSQGIWTCKTKTMTMTKADERGRLSRRLYVSLPTWEISIWTGSWVFGVGYAIYQLFLASKRKSWIVLFKHVTKGSQCGKEKKISFETWEIFREFNLYFGIVTKLISRNLRYKLNSDSRKNEKFSSHQIFFSSNQLFSN